MSKLLIAACFEAVVVFAAMHFFPMAVSTELFKLGGWSISGIFLVGLASLWWVWAKVK